jgi:hypothetical protein
MITMDSAGALLYVRQLFTDNAQILKYLYQQGSGASSGNVSVIRPPW